MTIKPNNAEPNWAMRIKIPFGKLFVIQFSSWATNRIFEVQEIKKARKQYNKIVYLFMDGLWLWS
jgi:hypothetical protein